MDSLACTTSHPVSLAEGHVGAELLMVTMKYLIGFSSNELKDWVYRSVEKDYVCRSVKGGLSVKECRGRTECTGGHRGATG